jgi:hypothetical protein
MSVTAILAVESSAISQVSFDYDELQVGVTYKSNPDKSYVFSCQNPIDVEDQVRTAESVGKLIAQLKNNKVLVPVVM